MEIVHYLDSIFCVLIETFFQIISIAYYQNKEDIIYIYDVGGGDGLFTAAPVLIGNYFVIILILFIVIAFSGLSQWKENEESPRLSVSAHVISKRTNIRRHNHTHDHNIPSYSSSTTYFITCEFDSGDRTEFRISGKEFGLLAEGDIGTLTPSKEQDLSVFLGKSRWKTFIEFNWIGR